MASKQYFDFLGSVWDNLPTKDRDRLGELWQGYEQIFAAAYQKYLENSLNIAIADLQTFSTERWLPYEFTSANFINQPAVFSSTQDISQGVNLLDRFLIKFSIDGDTPIEVTVQGANPQQTTIDEVISKINAATGFTFVSGIFENSILQFTSPTSGVASSIEFLITSTPNQNASEFLLGLLVSELPKKFPEFPWCFTSPYPNVEGVPIFRDRVRDESVALSLNSGTDFEVLNDVFCFKVEPIERLWAKRTLFNQEDPFNNYGFLMDIFQPNSDSYLTVLQGLWFAFWNGPKPENVRRALYLLFGLPTAPDDGTVTALTATTIEITTIRGLIQTFEIPQDLTALVALGDSVERFQPLVSGIEVFDKINKPGFIADEIGRAGIQRFLTESASRGVGDTDETKALTLLEEHTFLPQISVEALIQKDINLGNVTTFLTDIQPLSKTFLFQIIVGNFRDELDFKEKLQFDISLDVTPNVDANQTTFAEQTILDDYETIDNAALNLDSDGVLFQENVFIEVRSFGTLIDSFVA